VPYGFRSDQAGHSGELRQPATATDVVASGPARFQFGITSGFDGNLWTTGISLPNVTVQQHSNNQSPENAVLDGERNRLRNVLSRRAHDFVTARLTLASRRPVNLADYRPLVFFHPISIKSDYGVLL
jgi:hypothetical protein